MSRREPQGMTQDENGLYQLTWDNAPKRELLKRLLRNIGALLVVAAAVAGKGYLRYARTQERSRSELERNSRLSATSLRSGRLTPIDPTSFMLTVAPDGCAVTRTNSATDFHNLQWDIRDGIGAAVLQRNALGELAYRYFGSGTYEARLQAWGGDRYVPVSNTVTIHC